MGRYRRMKGAATDLWTSDLSVSATRADVRSLIQVRSIHPQQGAHECMYSSRVPLDGSAPQLSKN